jgi:tryptophan synthase alpha chain
MIQNRLTKALEQSKKFLSIYVTAGYPNLNDTVTIVENLEKSGVDFIELGMPFSDPMADGPVIQETSSIALKNGMNLRLYFEQVRAIRKTSSIPLIFMGYYNQIMRYGIEKFYQECQTSGIDGLIVPDLPITEFETQHQSLLEKYNISFTFLITPTTSPERIEKIDNATSGFIYVVSSNSITGKTNDFESSIDAYLQRIGNMSLSSKKIVGFGIHDKKSFDLATKNTDGAIIGSAFLKSLSQQPTELEITKFIQNIKH